MTAVMTNVKGPNDSSQSQEKLYKDLIVSYLKE